MNLSDRVLIAYTDTHKLQVVSQPGSPLRDGLGKVTSIGVLEGAFYERTHLELIGNCPWLADYPCRAAISLRPY